MNHIIDSEDKQDIVAEGRGWLHEANHDLLPFVTI